MIATYDLIPSDIRACKHTRINSESKSIQSTKSRVWVIVVMAMVMMTANTMICTPSLDDRWEGLDGHWCTDTINPFTPPASTSRVPLPLCFVQLCTYKSALPAHSLLLVP